MRPMPMVLTLLASLAACGGEPQAGTEGAAAAAAPSAARTEAASTSRKGEARKLSESSELYEFDYSYPAAAAAIPALRGVLENDIAARRAELAADARAGRADASEAGYEYRPYARDYAWQLVTELPGWLSLSAMVYSYSGGAHPNHGFDAMLWDKRAGIRRDAVDLFVSADALSRALRADFCRVLDRRRAEKRGEPVQPGSDSEFDRCIDPVENTVILGSSTRKAFDRIGVLVAPYAAGPYVEGSYEVTLPVTAEILALVKPEYRADFATNP